MKKQIIVGLGSCGIAAGAGKVYARAQSLIEAGNADVILKQTSCIGMCYKVPLVEVVEDRGHYIYGSIDV